MNTVTITGNVATHAETGKTYTYGTRGRKPSWLVIYEEKHGLPDCATAKTPKAKAEVILADCEVSFDAESRIVTNHTINKTYTIGQRGKRAAWVKEWLEANADTLQPVAQEELVTVE